MRLSSVALIVAFVSFAFHAHASVSQEREVRSCAKTGGRWIRLDSGCIQLCGEGEPECAGWRLYGCDCGEGMCWNGRGCLRDRSMEGAAAPRAAEAAAGPRSR